MQEEDDKNLHWLSVLIRVNGSGLIWFNDFLENIPHGFRERVGRRTIHAFGLKLD
jgi:hypothetical protein